MASLLANIGTWAQQVAQPWLLVSLGASPLLLGLDAFAAGAPVLLFTVLGGALADRRDRRQVIAFFQSVQMLCPLAIVALLLAGTLQPWMVIALSLVIGLTDALSMPSFQTIVSVLVTPRQLPTGIALNATQFNLSRILGPAVAGVLIASVGALGAYAVSAASYVPFILVALWALPRPGRVAAGDDAHDDPAAAAARDTLWVGLRLVLREKRLRLALATVFCTGLLCSPLITFCPVLVKAVSGDGLGRFSLTIAAFGVGGLIGSIALLGVDAERDRRGLSASGAVAFGALLVAAATCPWPDALPAVYLLAGIAMTVANACANTDLQAATLPARRGRAVSLFMLAMRGGLALGALVTGLTVSAFGVRHALLANGLVAVAVQAAVGLAWMRAQSRVRPARVVRPVRAAR